MGRYRSGRQYRAKLDRYLQGKRLEALRREYADIFGDSNVPGSTPLAKGKYLRYSTPSTFNLQKQSAPPSVSEHRRQTAPTPISTFTTNGSNSTPSSGDPESHSESASLSVEETPLDLRRKVIDYRPWKLIPISFIPRNEVYFEHPQPRPVTDLLRLYCDPPTTSVGRTSGHHPRGDIPINTHYHPRECCHIYNAMSGLDLSQPH